MTHIHTTFSCISFHVKTKCPPLCSCSFRVKASLRRMPVRICSQSATGVSARPGTDVKGDKAWLPAGVPVHQGAGWDCASWLSFPHQTHKYFFMRGALQIWSEKKTWLRHRRDLEFRSKLGSSFCTCTNEWTIYSVLNSCIKISISNLPVN